MTNLTLNKIVVRNFKAFRGEHSFQLNRPAGLYYVTGINKEAPELGGNGVGKSTLLADAIDWVLWGKTVRDNSPAAAVVPWGLDKETVEVSLHYTRDGKAHILTRTRRPNSLKLLGGGVEKEITQEVVPEAIGLFETTWRTSVVLGQMDKLFLDMRAEQQSNIFVEPLNLDLWLVAADKARERATTLDKLLQELEQELAGYKGGAVEVLAAFDKARKDERAADVSFRQQRRALAATADKLSARIAKLSGSAQGSARTGKAAAGKVKALGRRVDALGDALRQLHMARVKLYTKKDIAKSQLEEWSRTIETYSKSLDTDRTCPECGQKVSKQHLHERLDMTKERKTFLKKALLRIDKDIAWHTDEIDAKDARLEVLRKRKKKLEALCSELQAAESYRLHLKSTPNPHTKTIAELAKRARAIRANVRDCQEEIASVERRSKRAKMWVDGFKEIRISLIDSVLIELEMAVTRHAEALGLTDWQIKFQSEKQLVSGGVQVAFTVLLHPPGAEEPIKWFSYSGGESQRLQLAVAFGLSEVLLARTGVSPNIEVLDEPTRGLSSQGVADLIEHLSVRAKELNRAIYFVDHHSLDRGAFDGMVTIEKTDKGSRVL